VKNKLLIYSGFLIPFVFWLTTIVCGFIIGDNNHLTKQVSELGAIGTKSQYFFTFGLVLCSILSLFFIIGLYNTAKQIGLNTTPIFLLLTFSFSICGAALFPFPLKLHGILGMPSVMLFLSPLLTLFLWKTKKIPSIKYISIITLVIMLLGFSVYLPNFLGESLGLKQRFFHVGWSIWFVYLGSVFTGLIKRFNI